MAGAFIITAMSCENGHSIVVVNLHQSIEMTARVEKITIGFAILGLAFLAVKPFINPVPLLIWNASASVPSGWYFVAKHQPMIGEIAVIEPQVRIQLYASERGYLPLNVWLLKPIFAVQPSTICRFGSYVFVDGNYVTKAKIMDRKHRPLPVWTSCKILNSTQYFVLGRHRDSFDSRYFGPIEQRQVVGTAFPLSGLFK
jgi:type IV secretory pathway protease TraF